MAMQWTRERARSDLGRRIVRRRSDLALSQDEVARRAGMHPAYLDYIERSPNAVVGTTTLLRVAAALETSPAALSGSSARAQDDVAAGEPMLGPLRADECRARLEGGGVGRVVLTGPPAPLALPVNYTVEEGAVLFRTSPALAERIVSLDVVGFEVDEIDDVGREGWSVIVTGPAERVDESEDSAGIRANRPEPWAGGDRRVTVRIEPVHITGRAIARKPGTSGDDPVR